ncbi:Gfo/Idh/MocA family oxidoreductase [Paenibacillus doosanensis]|uniref:1,5-anhydro-D-fructose reductase n=1 Tax=Paenibacillus konkukensis TaxID=2020716 RepID=A0ABY4RVT9_9BACL|nr:MULTISPECIES: Gfo/Idh/MocA family oxidoreductase [Paenibacillus]MCS7460331.1 Gfo/Idh/MocA family oxidoreductase [Paenibacillus doosanensis]UQZ86123.1 1,5-anhydro-D-fructose reductase [Paenibacillus konkukensis]
MSEQTKVNIGVISLAHSHGRSYFRELASMPGVEIAGIADSDKLRAQPLADSHGASYYEDYRELLARPELDAVVICSENIHHAQLAIHAARAGKHILCEKPLGTTVPQMQAMIAASEENGVLLMTAFPCRYLPAVVQAKEAVDRGAVGDILAIKGTNRGSMPGGWFVDPALSGGGAVLDHTVHVMDLMRWFLGSEPARVYAEMGTLFHDLPVEDSGMVHVTFESGVIAVLDTSWSRSKSFPFWGDVTMEIIGTEGVISVDAFGQKNEVYSDEAGKAQWSHWGDRMDRYMLLDFVRAVRERGQAPISGEDGMRSAAVALAAYESVRRKASVDMKDILGPTV